MFIVGNYLFDDVVFYFGVNVFSVVAAIKFVVVAGKFVDTKNENN